MQESWRAHARELHSVPPPPPEADHGQPGAEGLGRREDALCRHRDRQERRRRGRPEAGKSNQKLQITEPEWRRNDFSVVCWVTFWYTFRFKLRFGNCMNRSRSNSSPPRSTGSPYLESNPGSNPIRKRRMGKRSHRVSFFSHVNFQGSRPSQLTNVTPCYCDGILFWK